MDKLIIFSHLKQFEHIKECIGVAYTQEHFLLTTLLMELRNKWDRYAYDHLTYICHHNECFIHACIPNCYS